ncbi:MAG: 4-hydroxy-tetrahydrodipicolinate reductase [Clostridia bacterium]|nr:4-hydroxy-tetrahydrodipicolinate reductase [Clostridia bacterium]
MIGALICGINGKMGKTVCELLQGDTDIRAVCGVDIIGGGEISVYNSFADIKQKVDIIIDFSSPSVLSDELSWAVKNNVPVVLAATGYSAEDLVLLESASKKIPIFKTGNFSLGINLLIKLVKQAAQVLGESFDIEIIEKHHNQKADAPSGTALMLADGINESLKDKREYLNGRSGAGKRGNEIGIHAVRGGTITGEHEVIFAGNDEIITLSHSAHSKRIFAAGAVRAAKWLISQPAGLYDMNDIFENI